MRRGDSKYSRNILINKSFNIFQNTAYQQIYQRFLWLTIAGIELNWTTWQAKRPKNFIEKNSKIRQDCTRFRSGRLCLNSIPAYESGVFFARFFSGCKPRAFVSSGVSFIDFTITSTGTPLDISVLADSSRSSL